MSTGPKSFKIERKFQPRVQIDLTPLIDLVFLLVAFFMITSSLKSQSVISVDLPKAVQTQKKDLEDIVISVTKNNEIYINNVKCSKKMLIVKFKEIHEKIKGKVSNVNIKGDKLANYETIVEVMDKLNQAGISNFVLSTVGND
jgi:biopolymer transport protein ExbD